MYDRARSSTKRPDPDCSRDRAGTPDGGPSSTHAAQHGPPSRRRQGSIVNVLPDEKRIRVLAALVDGNSVRAVERMTEVHQRTIRKFALALGEGAERLHNRIVRDLRPQLVSMDEIWGYCLKKEARVQPGDPPDAGEQYTFVAIDTLSRLVIAWHVGKRNQASTDAFMANVRARVLTMPQITTDGFAPYIPAVGAEFGWSAQYTQTVKNYRSGGRRDDHRYEPPRDPFITKKIVYGAPDLDKASTALVERLNGTTRHFVGRMRRLSYAFSKTLAGHRAAMALHYVHYNFCHVVRTLRVTPAMQAGLTDHVWTLDELMSALLAAEPCERPAKMPLEHPVPEGPARELPNGRGFLRLVTGGGSPAPQAPTPPAPSPDPVAPAQAAPAQEPWTQLDLLEWRPAKQLSLFEEDELSSPYPCHPF